MLLVGFQMWCYNQNEHSKQSDEPKFILGFILTKSELREFITRNVNQCFPKIRQFLSPEEDLSFLKENGVFSEDSLLLQKQELNKKIIMIHFMHI